MASSTTFISVWSEQWHYNNLSFCVSSNQIIDVLRLHMYFNFRCACQCVFIPGLYQAVAHAVAEFLTVLVLYYG